MDVVDIRSVIAIGRAGSISAAAALLGTSQSALTKQLQRIEDELDVRLFERQPRGVEATHYGRRIMERGADIQRDLSDLMGDITALKDGSLGEIRIGAGQTWVLGPIAEAIARALDGKNQLRLIVTTDPVERMMADLVSGRLDFVLTAWIEGQDFPDIEWSPLIVDDLRVFARKAHPLHRSAPRSIAQLRSWPWVLPARGNPTRLRFETLFRNEGLIAPEPVVETASVTLTDDLVSRTDFLALLPAVRFPGARPGLRAINSAALGWKRSSGIYSRKDRYLPPATEAFFRELRAVCARYYSKSSQ